MKVIKWEYWIEIVENMNRLSLASRLASLGNDGWEFVQAIRSHRDVSFTMLVFKRPIELTTLNRTEEE